MSASEITSNIIIALVAIGVLSPIALYYYLLQRKEEQQRRQRRE